MIANICRAVRREIDEADLDQQLSGLTVEHLHECDACRGFHDERRSLRGLMASFETVAAPSDFDFRLRARLTREKSGANGRFSFAGLPGGRSLAAVAIVLAIAVAGILFRNWKSTANKETSAVASATNAGSSERANRAQSTSTASAAENVNEKPIFVTRNDRGGDRSVLLARHSGTPTAKNGQRSSGALARNNRPTATREFLGTGAEVITPNQAPISGLLLVPIDSRALKVSVDNGRGVARTISLPPVSFGSERLLTSSNSFQPVSGSKAW